MAKNKLISFILQNLEELRTTTELMKEMEVVPEKMYGLALQKMETLKAMYGALAVGDTTGFAETADEHTEEWQEAVAQLSEEEKEETNAEAEEARRREAEERMIEEEIRREEEEARRKEEEERKRKEEEERQRAVAEAERRMAEEKARQEEEMRKKIEAEMRQKMIEEETKRREEEERRKAEATQTSYHQQGTLNDRFKTNVRHFGEEKNVESKFVNDLKSAISTNDVIRFSRAFCGGERSLFLMAVAKMNEMPTFADANNYITEELRWDCSKGAGADFIKIVENKFAQK